MSTLVVALTSKSIETAIDICLAKINNVMMDAFAGKIIEGIASLAVEEFRFIWNLKADQERMKRITTSIKAVLLDAEAKATNNQITTLSSYLLNGDKLRTFHVPRQPIHSSRDLVFSFGSLISLRCLRVLTLRALDITKPHLQELELQWQWQCEEEAISLVSDPLFNRGFKTTIQQEEDGLKDEVILEGLQPHQSIKRLVINGFCGKKLPDWIGNLTELAVLEINNCDGLTSLPEGLRNLKSLQRLCIYSCSQLEESCARNHGDEWNKISHIPKVLILPLPPSLLKYIN
ncbi:hypothetical protein Ahy_A08g040387 isoform D [Arachis hypogaea]|uniref:R13L1/DRL21-like LRR repeat region domain-containing protein n=1 Tax=Arachis hypogaea TaxID=3818 RepID=A0A445BZR9_ARAHY|nr:hypothetical protein Ahy_A08g040387 isoform D [Arachis hypogaea]